MQQTTRIAGKSRTARQIIAAQTGRTQGDDYTSEIDGERVVWDYRRHDDDQGLTTQGSRVCEPADADCIGIDDGEEIVILALSRRDDPRYVASDDDRAVLRAWAGADEQSCTLDMGGWTDSDESAFRAAIADEMRFGAGEVAKLVVIEAQ